MGVGFQGNLGNGGTSDVNTPTHIGTEGDWNIISSGFHNCAIKNNGTLWSWGSNDVGQMGDGSYLYKTVPTEIGNSTWSVVRVGGYHTVAIDTNGNLFVWGYNNYGQLGDGTTIKKNIPIHIGSDCQLSVESFNKPIMVNIYPNPTTNEISLEYELAQAGNIEIFLCNSVGQVLQRDSFDGSKGRNKRLISLEDLSSGIYILVIDSNNFKKRMKVIKE